MKKATRHLTFTEFVGTLLAFVLTPAQRVLCAVCFDGVQPSALSDEARELARRIFGDVDEIEPTLRRVVAWVKGARIGGTLMGALRAVHLAITISLDRLAFGEMAFVIFVGPDVRIARQALRYALGAVQAIPALASRVTQISEDGFTLERSDGRLVRFEALPATRGGSALRGRSFVFVQFTEFAFARDDNFVVNDVELLKAVVPRVLPNGQVLIESTPWIESGELFRLWSEWGTPTSALVAHCPTTLLRDDDETRRWVEQERRRDPDNAEREADARFVTTGGGMFFDASLIDAAVRRGDSSPSEEEHTA